MKKVPAFTLIEVLISVTILSTLLVALIKSESETSVLLTFTKQLEKAQKHTGDELMAIFRSQEKVSEGFSEGAFEEKDEMFGYRWKKEVIEEELFTISMYKVTYTLSWKDRFRDRSYQASIYVRKE